MQNARKVQSEETRLHLRDAHSRVMSIATLQQQLAASGLGDVEIRPYLTQLCRSIAASMIPDPERLTLDVVGDDSTTTGDISVSLGLIVTELVINAIKYAFPSPRADSLVLVRFESDGDAWVLSVTDNGVGAAVTAAPLSHGGLGTAIVEALAKQLDARMDVRTAVGMAVSIRHDSLPAQGP